MLMQGLWALIEFEKGRTGVLGDVHWFMSDIYRSLGLDDQKALLLRINTTVITIL